MLQEFKRIKGNINSMREHAELLSSVRDDINEYKVNTATPGLMLLHWICLQMYIQCILKNNPYPICFIQSPGTMSPRVQLLRERAAIHGSIAHVSLNKIYWWSSLFLQYTFFLKQNVLFNATRENVEVGLRSIDLFARCAKITRMLKDKY